MRWFFTERSTGRLVVAQLPNAPLWLWIAGSVAHRLTGWQPLAWLASAALGVWAVLELFRGASPFRRVLGAGVLAWLVLSVT